MQMSDSIGLLTGRFYFFSLCMLFSAFVCLPVFSEDCNRNGVEDGIDINAQTSLDCDADGVPDECQLAPVDFSSPMRERAPRRRGGPASPPAAAPEPGAPRRSAGVGAVSLRQNMRQVGHIEIGGEYLESPNWSGTKIMIHG